MVLDDERLFARVRFLAAPAWNGAILAGMIALQGGLQHVPWLIYVCPYLVALFLVGALLGRAPWLRFLASGPLRQIGVRSYGVYLVHLFGIAAAERVFTAGTGSLANSVGALLLAIVFSIAMAAVMYRLVERPCIDVGRRLSRRILDARPPTGASPPPRPACGPGG